MIGKDDVDAAGGEIGHNIAVGLNAVVARLHAPIVVVRLQHGPRIGKIHFRHKYEKGKRVVKTTHEEHFPSLAAGQVFIKQEKIVAEIQLRVPRI